MVNVLMSESWLFALVDVLVCFLVVVFAVGLCGLCGGGIFPLNVGLFNLTCDFWMVKY